jgi:phage gpG-like protein
MTVKRTTRLKITVEGAKEITRTLENMGRKANDILDEAADKAGLMAYRKARDLAPTSLRGQLYGRFKHSAGNLRRAVKFQRAKKSTKKKGYANSYVFIDTNIAPYAPFVIFGHKSLNGSKVPGNPFMKKAVDTQRKAIKESIESTIVKAIDRAMR